VVLIHVSCSWIIKIANFDCLVYFFLSYAVRGQNATFLRPVYKISHIFYTYFSITQRQNWLSQDLNSYRHQSPSIGSRVITSHKLNSVALQCTGRGIVSWRKNSSRRLLSPFYTAVSKMNRLLLYAHIRLSLSAAGHMGIGLMMAVSGHWSSARPRFEPLIVNTKSRH